MGEEEGNFWHTMTLLPGKILLMVGGMQNREGSIWLMDLNGPQWDWLWENKPEEWPHLWEVRHRRDGHSATLIGTNVFLFGGYWSGYKNDLWVLDSTTMELKEYHNHRGPVPEPRARHGAVALEGKLYVFGGYGGNYLNDLHQLNPEDLLDL